MACYALLTINHKDDTALCWCHVDRATKELGISKQSWSNALSRLRSKTFTAPDGKQYPVLVKVKNAHSGQCATYADNPYAVAIGLPPAMPSKEGTRPQVPKRYTPTFTNQHGEGTRPDAERYTPTCTHTKKTIKKKVYRQWAALCLPPKQSEAPPPHRSYLPKPNRYPVGYITVSLPTRYQPMRNGYQSTRS